MSFSSSFVSSSGISLTLISSSTKFSLSTSLPKSTNSSGGIPINSSPSTSTSASNSAPGYTSTYSSYSTASRSSV